MICLVCLPNTELVGPGVAGVRDCGLHDCLIEFF